jgi:hypothetical protein
LASGVFSPALARIALACRDKTRDLRLKNCFPTELGLRKQFFKRKSLVLSLQASAILASAGENTPEAKLGDGSVNYEIRGLAGRSFTFKDRPGFLDVQTAYRARPNEVTDEWRLDITAGLDVRPNLQILSQAFAISTPKPGSDTTIPYKSLKLQPSIVYRASESLSYQFGGFATLSGEYALAERGLFIGLWKTY